jgi:hypothetical protein
MRNPCHCGYRKIIGCRKNILSIFVALLTFYNKEKRRKKKKISHFKMPTLNSDVTVNSYNWQYNVRSATYPDKIVPLIK